MDNITFEKKIIIIVDDHKAVLNAMCAFLESYGAKVLAYGKVHDFLRDIPYADCLIVDYYMPELNGLELAAELQKRQYSAPVIILTGMSSEIPKDRLAASGVRVVVEKFAGYEALLRAVNDAVRG